MSWTDVDLTGVSTEMETIPEGSYAFALLPGAKYNQWQPGKVEVGAKITEGDYAGRVCYFSYGDPDKVPSMVQAFKRLEVALVTDGAPAAEAGEDPVTYLNNPEVVGKRFLGPVRHRLLPAKDDLPAQTKVDVAVFKVKAVPNA